MQPVSYDAIVEQLDLSQPLPVTPNWSAAADFLQLLLDHCLENPPVQIIECSSGVTTLVLAACCRLTGRGWVVSLENGAEYAEQFRQALHELDLDGYARVIHAPLRQYRIGNEHYAWYSLDELPAMQAEMLVIDGPPGFLQRHSRYPALPLLTDRISADCTVFLDDAAREDEQQLVRRWLNQQPGWVHRFIDTERGCSVLHRQSI